MAGTANTVWEVWTTGASTNGGGFDPTVSVPGTDFSQQTGAQKTYTDIIIDAVDNTKATSILTPFVASDVGNVYNFTSGTGFTLGRFVLISQAAGVGTFNAAIGTTASVGGNAKMGGALTQLTNSAIVAGNKTWVKATATYSVTGTTALNTAGTSGAFIQMEGYTTTRGDGGQVTFSRSSGSTFTIISGSGNFQVFRNIIADGTSGTTIGGFNVTGTNIIYENCKAINCTNNGMRAGGAEQFFRNCWVTACSGTAAFIVNAATTVQFVGCIASANTVTGFLVSIAGSTATTVFLRCIAANNTGGSSQGFKVNATTTASFFQCIAYANGSDGILYDTTTSASCADGGAIQGCILDGNSGYGINANAANLPFFNTDYNAFNGNSGGPRNNLPVGAHDVSLSGSPFTNGGSLDFSLNNTTGAGAACRAVGWPGALQAGGTGYSDIGALQHQDAGGMIMSRVRTGF